jgi:hypothetical protein
VRAGLPAAIEKISDPRGDFDAAELSAIRRVKQPLHPYLLSLTSRGKPLVSQPNTADLP